MFDLLTINIAVELFGVLICLTVILSRNFLVGTSHQKTRFCFTLMVFCEALVLFSSALAGIFSVSEAPNADILQKVLIYSRFTFIFTLVGLLTEYSITCFNPDRVRFIRIFTWSVLGVSLIGLTVNIFIPVFYSVSNAQIVQKKWFTAMHMPCVAICVENLIMYIKHRKNVTTFVLSSFIMYILIPVAALFVQTATLGLDLVNMSLIIVLMYMYVVMQNQFANEYAEQKRMLQESKTKLMISQIKPHFIFNSLTSIAQLCDDDPKTAKSTTIAFANYLRGNLKSFEQAKPVPFSDELLHIRNYLEIEGVRFGELLKVEYNIETEDFKVPALSVQPLIENAVKHGVGMKEDGGTVILSALKKEGGVLLEIEDNGVGFDPETQTDSGEHIGLTSAGARFKNLCDADMKIVSVIGEGTRISIFIPTENEE